MYKDYVFKITDTPAYRNALYASAQAEQERKEALAVIINDSVSTEEIKEDAKAQLKTILAWAMINDNDDPKITFAKSMVGRLGTNSVSVCRLSQEQADWFDTFNQVTLVGTAKQQYIRAIADVDWIGPGKGLYHQVHKQDQIENEDGSFSTPSELHCVIYTG